jgi:multiple sugar transport system substrate-binding protein
MKKICMLSLLGCALMMAFSACHNRNQTQKAETSVAEKVDSGVKTITFWHYMSANEGKATQKIIDEFNASQNSIFVKAQFLPRNELMKQYTIGAVSHELPDCGMVDNPDLNSYAAMGVFEDITNLYKNWSEAEFLSGPLNSCIYNGKIYGLPWTSNCLGLFYNKELFKKAEVTVPSTWSELESACAKLTTGSVKGLAISAIGNEEGTFQYMPWLLTAGGQLKNLESRESKSSLQYLKRLLDKGYISKECINWTQADAEKRFAAGQAAMMINGPWQFPELKADAPDLDYGVAKIPRADTGKYASILGGENVVICKGADVKSAWTFLTYVTNKVNSEKICKAAGYFSPRSDIDVNEMFKDDPKNATLAGLMPEAQSRGPSSHWPEISEALYTAEQEVFTDQKTPDDAMAEAKTKIDKINSTDNK